MDTSIKPGDDFYMYVNSLWQENTEIPADKTSTGPYVDLQESAFEEVKAILEELAADAGTSPGSDRRKLGDWYASMMDVQAIDKLGLAPIKPELDSIAAISNRPQLEQVLADGNGGLGAKPIVIGFEYDRKKIDTSVVNISVAGLSIPIREIYIAPEYETVRNLHLEHIARMLALAGFDNSEDRARHVQSVEKRIAEITWTKTELRDRSKQYNPLTLPGLTKLAPGIDWKAFLKNAGADKLDRINVETPSTISGLAKLVAEVPLQDWRDYLAYHLLANTQQYLPKALRDEYFSFYTKTLGGQPEPDPRWKVALLDTGGDGRPLMDTLSQAFITRYIPTDTVPQMNKIIKNILAAFDDRLARLDWMTPETRAAARKKLSKVTIKAVSSGVWNNADGLKVVRGDAVGNARRAADFIQKRKMSYLDILPDRDLFLRPAFLVNAYANPVWNEIVFLAAIIRPPFFDPEADPAVNYGAIGSVIGHEVSHLFDDQGRKVDGDGLLNDWWTEKDAKNFVAAADALASQVASYEVLPGKHMNGQLTLGESIGDEAGLVIAYEAYRHSLGGKKAPVLDGYNGDQRFFLSYAQMWRWKGREAYIDKLLKSDPHPLTNYRPRTMRNIDAWYKAFAVKPGDALYLPPDKRVNIW